MQVRCNDDVQMQIDPTAVHCIGTISDMIKVLGSDESASSQVIPLPGVSSAIMKKVLAYVEHHKNDPPLPEDYEQRIRENSSLDPWDESFLKVDQATLIEIINAANYLNIKTLLDVSCKTVANQIRGKSVEEIRSLFNIVSDFKPEEEEAIRKENEWLSKYC